jgi:hypothetical protein
MEILILITPPSRWGGSLAGTKGPEDNRVSRVQAARSGLVNITVSFEYPFESSGCCPCGGLWEREAHPQIHRDPYRTDSYRDSVI